VKRNRSYQKKGRVFLRRLSYCIFSGILAEKKRGNLFHPVRTGRPFGAASLAANRWVPIKTINPGGRGFSIKEVYLVVRW
jgi:hypothetical protein